MLTPASLRTGAESTATFALNQYREVTDNSLNSPVKIFGYELVSAIDTVSKYQLLILCTV